MAGRGRSPPAALAYEASKTLQLDVLGPHHTSPSSNVQQIPSNNQHENDELEERRASSGHQGTGSSLSGGTEAAVARDAFEGMIETLSRTKESIARATRLAIDCAKFGLANEVVTSNFLVSIATYSPFLIQPFLFTYCMGFAIVNHSYIVLQLH